LRAALAHFLLLLTACARPTATPYLPPTSDLPATPLVVRLPPTATGAVDGLRASATPTCQPGLTFQEDLTIPDGTLVSPGEALDKRWLVENSGSCNWDEQYRLKWSAGPDLGAPREQALFPARSGTSATIRIQFVAPAEPGIYRSAWQAHDPAGEPFGDPIYIEIVVR
jgi:hypothetical protein